MWLIISKINTHHSDLMNSLIVAIVASVVATTCRPHRFLLSLFSMPQANFLLQACIASLVKHLSPYTRRISLWIAFALSFSPQKWTMACCSVQEDFSGSATILSANDVTVMSLFTNTGCHKNFLHRLLTFIAVHTLIQSYSLWKSKWVCYQLFGLSNNTKWQWWMWTIPVGWLGVWINGGLSLCLHSLGGLGLLSQWWHHKHWRVYFHCCYNNFR